jgi:uncharacterized integral membrane protein (TIGR00697 family)
VIFPTADTTTRKRGYLYIFLAAIFLTNALLAEVIGVKIFSLEGLLGTQPAQLNLLGFTLDFNLTAGVVLWPFVFVTSDVINEYFGKQGVQRISFLAAGFICYAFLAIWVTTGLPPAAFWLDVNKGVDGSGAFNIDTAFNAIFRQGLGIIIGSITAFLVGQLLDAYVFHAIKKLTGSKKVWLRATASTLVSQGIDSFVVLIVAFYLFGNWSFEQVIAVGIINYIYKSVMAVVMIPLLYVAHYFIDGYLGVKE